MAINLGENTEKGNEPIHMSFHVIPKSSKVVIIKTNQLCIFCLKIIKSMDTNFP